MTSTTMTTTNSIKNKLTEERPRQPRLRTPGSWREEKPNDVSPIFFCDSPLDNQKPHGAEGIRSWIESDGQKSGRLGGIFGRFRDTNSGIQVC